MRLSLPVLGVAIVLFLIYIGYYLSRLSVFSWDTTIPLFYFVATFMAFIAIYLRLGELEHR